MPLLPALRSGVFIVDGGEGAVVFESASGLLHELNVEAALVLDACIRGWTVHELVNEIAEVTKLPPPRIETDIESCLGELRLRGIVEDDIVDPGLATSAPGSGGLAEAISVQSNTERPGPAFSSSPLRVIEEVVVLQSNDRDLISYVDAVFADLSVTEQPTVHGELTVRNDKVWLRSADRAFERFNEAGVDRGDLPTVLNSVAGMSAACLALHAGVVRSPSGVVVALAGLSGSGKSTLVAGLVLAGWSYLSDEVLAVRPDTLSVIPYPKPLVLDAASREVLGLPEGDSHLVRAGDLRPGAPLAVHETVSLGHLVIVEYQPGAEASLVPIASGATLTALAPHALNLRCAGQSGLETLVEVSRSRPCHRLIRGDIDSARKALEGLVDRGPSALGNSRAAGAGVTPTRRGQCC